MSNEQASLAMEALRTAASHVEAPRAEFEREQGLLAMMMPEPVLALVQRLVRLTGKAPEWHLGHLRAEPFAVVCEILGTTPHLRVHDDGARFLIMEVKQHGLVLRAQTSAPPAEQDAGPLEHHA